MKIDIEKEIIELIKNNSISKKDESATRLILTWMHYGRKRAEKLKGVKKYIENLEKNGFVDKKSGNLLMSSTKDKDIYIEFLLMINGAHGFIKRVEEPKKKIIKRKSGKKKK